MKVKTLLVVLMMLFVCTESKAQYYKTKAIDDIASKNLLSVGCKVENLTITDLNGNPTELPYWGKKNVLIFYVDPDAYLNGNKTADFASEIEENKRAQGPGIEGFGIMNFPDTALPKDLLRKICRKRTAKNGAIIVDDDKHLLKNAWNLGNVNGKFLLIVVDKQGIVRYIRREPMDAAGKAEFYEMSENYKYE